MSGFITGIQQCGIGVRDAMEAALYYKDLFGFSAVVFDDIAEASLMTRYTGNKMYRRRAILTMNMQGGGGLEMWQFLEREPKSPTREIQFGDLGINAIKIKTRNLREAYHFFKNREDVTLIFPGTIPDSATTFLLQDKYNNLFEIVEKKDFFNRGPHVCAGVCGAIIGVSDLPVAIHFYKHLFGLSEKGETQKLQTFLNSSQIFDRQIMNKDAGTQGAFSALLGDIELEILQINSSQPIRIFENRFWGDLGFIHLCFDVLQMDKIKSVAEKLNRQFTVDSKGFFKMEKAGGRFCYVEDPDGTLIEMVQTFKIPLLKKLGLYLNLENRKNNNPLPRLLIKMMGFNKLSEN